MTEQACASWCGTRDWSLSDEVWFRKCDMGKKATQIDGFCTDACRVAERPLHPQSVPPTGMQPGQRCTAIAGHMAARPHEHFPAEAANWRTFVGDFERCPYVQPPAPTGSGAGPACADAKRALNPVPR